MDLRQCLFEIAAEHRLDAAGTARLERVAGLHDQPRTLTTALPRAVAVLAAALGGLGIVFWIAANWQTLGRFGRFALLQAFVVAMCAGALLAACRARAARPARAAGDRRPVRVFRPDLPDRRRPVAAVRGVGGAGAAALHRRAQRRPLGAVGAGRDDRHLALGSRPHRPPLARRARRPRRPSRRLARRAGAGRRALSAPLRRHTGAGVWALRVALALARRHDHDDRHRRARRPLARVAPLPASACSSSPGRR